MNSPVESSLPPGRSVRQDWLPAPVTVSLPVQGAGGCREPVSISNTKGKEPPWSPGCLCCLTDLQREGCQQEVRRGEEGKTAAFCSHDVKIRGRHGKLQKTNRHVTELIKTNFWIKNTEIRILLNGLETSDSKSFILGDLAGPVAK